MNYSFRLVAGIFGVVILLATSCNTSQKERSTSSTTIVKAEERRESSYDSLLAQHLGADEYGMKPYVIAFLKAGPNRSQDSTEAMELQKAHMDNIGRLAEMGKLVLAGPFMDDSDLRGIYVFNVATIEEARQLTATDPAIQAGSLEMELHPWYGSAAVMQINDIHNRITRSAH